MRFHLKKISSKNSLLTSDDGGKKSNTSKKFLKNSKKLIQRPLPQKSIKDPIVAHGEYVLRVTTVFLGLMIVFFGTWLLARYTGFASSATTVNITDSISVNCFIDVESGLNIISFNCLSNSGNRSLVFAQTNLASIDAVYDYRVGETDKWKVYNPQLPSWVVQDLTQISRLRGYLLYANAPATINYTGFLALQSVVPLLSGNNIAGYPSIIVDTLPEALTTINDTYLRIRTYNSSDGWVEYNYSDNSSGGLFVLEPTRGYWMTMNESDAWTVRYNRTS